MVGLAMIVSAAGLLCGQRFGWWCTMSTVIFAACVFAVFPIMLHGSFNVRRPVYVHFAVYFTIWVYLHKASVREYFAIGHYYWMTPFLIAAVSLVLVYLVVLA